MQRIALLGLFPLLLASLGCVSKGEHEAVQAELATCQEGKAQAQAQVITWEQRFDRENKRWESIEASVSQQVPQALSEIHEERQKILALVPEQVQTEVATYLEDYFRTVMGGFERLSKDNQKVQMQLEATQTVLENLGADTKAISESIDGALAEERSKATGEAQKREEVAQEIAQIVTLITQFDSTKVNCKKCPDSLGLKRKKAEEVAAFHSDLIAKLSELQTFADEMPREEP